MKVKEISNINRSNIDMSANYDCYQYLDTGSIYDNKIDELQVFFDKESLPSRAKRIVKNGDIIISTVRPIQRHFGCIENPEENLLVSTGFTVISPNNEFVNGRYLYYYLTCDKITKYFQMIAESSVSSYPSITSDIIGNLEIKLPKRDIQNQIAEKIKVLDDRLNTNNDIIETLELYCQLTFNKWFIDYNFPNKNAAPYNDTGEKMIVVKDKKIPKGWDYGFITNLGKIVGGGTPSLSQSEYFQDNGIPWLTPKDLSDNPSMYTERGNRDISEVGLRNSSATLVPARSVLMSSRAPIGYLTISKNPITTNQGFKSVVPFDDRYAEFIYYSLKNRMKKILLSSSGSTFSEISKGMMERLETIIPESDIIIKFHQKLKPLFDKIDAISLEQEVLRNMRNLFIKKNIG